MSLSALSDYRSCLVKRPPAFVRGLDVKLYHDSSILYKSLFLFLDLDGDSADHQDNLVRFRGNILVEPALHIGKFTLHLVYRHASHTQLVRHEDQVGILPGEFIELRFEEGER